MVEFDDHFKRRFLSVADGTFDSVYTHKFKGSKFRKLSVMHALTLLIRYHNYVMIQNFLFLIHPPQCIAVVSHPTKENEPIIKCETLVIS